MSDLNIAFDRHASIGTVMHYILVISVPNMLYRKPALIMICDKLNRFTGKLTYGIWLFYLFFYAMALNKFSKTFQIYHIPL